MSQVAAEVDRLVVGAFTAAVTQDDAPDGPTGLDALSSGFLHTFAFPMLAGPLTQADLSRIVPYTPGELIDQIVVASVAADLVEVGGDTRLHLTASGRRYAADIVNRHDAAAQSLWREHESVVETLLPLVGLVVHEAVNIPRPLNPAVFNHFARFRERPTRAGQLLRLVTALRYWRADAHRSALLGTDLKPAEAHALNRLWDYYRGIHREGQNYSTVSPESCSALERRGLAYAGRISPAGLVMREGIEARTDLLTEPLWSSLTASSERQHVHQGLAILPS